MYRPATGPARPGSDRSAICTRAAFIITQTSLFHASLSRARCFTTLRFTSGYERPTSGRTSPSQKPQVIDIPRDRRIPTKEDFARRSTSATRLTADSQKLSKEEMMRPASLYPLKTLKTDAHGHACTALATRLGRARTRSYTTHHHQVRVAAVPRDQAHALARQRSNTHVAVHTHTLIARTQNTRIVSDAAYGLTRSGSFSLAPLRSASH
ncbi:hypothetical protein BJ912DRAFT_1100185 [Pholiota molesta]|nr:hypothetical protein BJ912DRAFT_1098062 [Pholiota molesta]KAF8190907.1 hypothetical protein BJ912DRAFT_1100185 [Pholiota molesta]